MTFSPNDPAMKQVAYAWDPKNPAALLVANHHQPQQNNNGGDAPDSSEASKMTAMKINTIFSHTGVGCNEHEIAALMQLIISYEQFSELPSSQRSDWNNIQTLSKDYRRALRDCLIRWEDNILELEEEKNNNGSTAMMTTDGIAQQQEQQEVELSVENLELLKLLYAVTHLSEIFMLSPNSEISQVVFEDIFDVAGGLTAETVRYLRHHHLANAWQNIDPECMQSIMESHDPDQMDGGKPYWDLMHKLVRRGNLEQAWALLSRHSLCRRAIEATANLDDESMENYEAASLKEYKEGFMDMRRIFLSAPIPGGRDDANDIGLDDDDDDPSSSGEAVILLEGVEPGAYRMWETSRPADGGDYPLSYNHTAAYTKLNNWKQYILEMESINRLKRRIPQLDHILRMMCGDLKGVQFESWAEALITELIYSNPTVLPGDIHTRGRVLMRKFSRVHGEMDEVLLNIMQGVALHAIEVLHALGGGSGAALPTTMTFLLSRLYFDAKRHAPLDFQTSLLQAAAFSICSSLADKNGDVGTSLAIRLLLPSATPKGDPSAVAMIGTILGHHTPRSDSETRELISLCQQLVEKKSVLVLEGCVSTILCRYRLCLRDGLPGGAMHWLLVGIELESFLCRDIKTADPNVQQLEATSVCYIHLVTWCRNVAASLLQGIVNEQLRALRSDAEEMIKSAKDGPLEAYVTKLPEVRTLELIVGIFDGLLSKDFTSVGKNITLCLQEEKNENDGVVSSLAPRGMHWNLLQLGCRLVDADEERRVAARGGQFIPSFDVKGVQVLLEQLTIIPISREVEGLKPLPPEIIKKMTMSLGKALSRAFIAENALRKKKRPENAEDASLITGIRSVDLHNHSLAIQEEVVQKMLDI